MKDKAAFSWEMTREGGERERERFNVFKVNHVNLIDLTFVNKCSMKNRTLLKSTIDRSSKDQRSDC